MSDLNAPAPRRKLSTPQLVLIGLGVLLAAFLVLGTLIQPATPEATPLGVPQASFATLAVLAFAGGLLSFISPCTLPVLTAYFAFAFQSDRQRIAANTLAFMLGLATTFSLLGAVGFALGRVLVQSQSVLMLVGGAVILVLGVMSLLGRGFGGATTFSERTFNPGMGGSYLFGLTFAVGWSACVGPILGVILTLAFQTATVWQGMMLLFIYTLGLGLPLMIVATFFGRMSRQSAFWRALRGKGWQWDTSVFVVALVWALAIWRICRRRGAVRHRQLRLPGRRGVFAGPGVGHPRPAARRCGTVDHHRLRIAPHYRPPAHDATHQRRAVRPAGAADAGRADGAGQRGAGALVGRRR